MSENWCTPKPKLTERPLLDTENAESLRRPLKYFLMGHGLEYCIPASNQMHLLARWQNS